MKKHTLTSAMRLMAIAVAAFSASGANAAITLPQFFTDSMVVQQNATLTIPGTARPKATVKITPSWSNATITTKADKRGHFSAKVPTPAASTAAQTITVTDGRSTAVLADVLVGEVWLCSGQSNMEMQVGGWGHVIDFRREIANADYPMLRLLQIKKTVKYEPQADTEVTMGGWRPATAATVDNFSAIGYFFGRTLVTELKDTPIGIIDCTWGGTPIESWMAAETLGAAGQFGPEIGLLAELNAANGDPEAIETAYADVCKKWEQEMMPGNGPEAAAYLHEGAKEILMPSTWETSANLMFNGVIWLQKEFDVPAAAAGKPAIFNIGGIDDDDITYINGTEVGRHTGVAFYRRYEIPAGVLKAGKNLISIRVCDTGGLGGIYPNGEGVYVEIEGGEKINVAGQWFYDIAADFSKVPSYPTRPDSSNYPTVLYNAMLSPLQVMPVQGVLWYQGCANVGRDQQYSVLFKDMINQWRNDWKNPDMSFYFVQLAAYLQPSRFQPNSEWAALRQAQKDALELDGTAMAVAIDLGNPTDIHPKNKQEVARRLAMAALNRNYGRTDVNYLAPCIKEVTFDGPYTRITFDAPLMLNGGGQGFVVKGRSGNWAEGYGHLIAPDTLEVWSEAISHPVEVRYDWADYPEGNLRGLDGLPVSPFTTAHP